MRIIRYPSISEQQFFGCTAAFVDSLSGEMNAALSALRRLESRNKGAAFAYEMTLDTHRYGALIVIDRWSTLTRSFGPHLTLSRQGSILQDAAERVRTAEDVLARTNQLIDASDSYAPALVEACAMAFRTVEQIFREERGEAEQSAKLGPMLSEDYTSARRIFLEDLAAR